MFGVETKREKKNLDKKLLIVLVMVMVFVLGVFPAGVTPPSYNGVSSTDWEYVS